MPDSTRVLFVGRVARALNLWPLGRRELAATTEPLGWPGAGIEAAAS